jgi:hypothetical protein
MAAPTEPTFAAKGFGSMWGLRDTAAQLAAGPVVIAYLGNSVTAQKDGYRPYLHKGLVKRFGHEHKAVNAGFGGVGSIGSVCTMDDHRD